MAKQKTFGLKGEAENAANLNKYTAYSKSFQAGLPKAKPRTQAPTGPSVTERRRGASLIAKGDLKPTLDSTINKLGPGSSRADSVKAYTNVAKGVAKAEANRIQANRLINTAYNAQEKGRIAKSDVTSVTRDLATPLAPTYGRTPQENQSLAKALQAKK